MRGNTRRNIVLQIKGRGMRAPHKRTAEVGWISDVWENEWRSWGGARWLRSRIRGGSGQVRAHTSSGPVTGEGWRVTAGATSSMREAVYRACASAE